MRQEASAAAAVSSNLFPRPEFVPVDPKQDALAFEDVHPRVVRAFARVADVIVRPAAHGRRRGRNVTGE